MPVLGVLLTCLLACAGVVLAGACCLLLFLRLVEPDNAHALAAQLGRELRDGLRFRPPARTRAAESAPGAQRSLVGWAERPGYASSHRDAHPNVSSRFLSPSLLRSSSMASPDPVSKWVTLGAAA